MVIEAIAHEGIAHENSRPHRDDRAGNPLGARTFVEPALFFVHLKKGGEFSSAIVCIPTIAS